MVTLSRVNYTGTQLIIGLGAPKGEELDHTNSEKCAVKRERRRNNDGSLTAGPHYEDIAAPRTVHIKRS